MPDTKDKNLKVDSLENLLPLFNKIIKDANSFRDLTETERNIRFKNVMVDYFEKLPIPEIRRLAVDLDNVYGLLGTLTKFVQVLYVSKLITNKEPK
jgi:hypothetical protein